MALSGLDIYKLLPKTNCKECGFATCLAFAMQLAKKAVSIEKCPYLSKEAKDALEASSLPPIKLVTVGQNEGSFSVGNETVMFRHEEKFHNPAGLGFIIDDSLVDSEIKTRLNKIGQLRFERVGQQICVNLVAIRSVGNSKRFSEVVKLAMDNTNLALVLMSNIPESIKEALEIAKSRKPLIYAATKDNLQEIAIIVKGYNVPLVVSDSSLDSISNLTVELNKLGINELVLDTQKKSIKEKIWDLTQIRRQALKKSNRSLGYPSLVIVENDDPFEEAIEVATYISKYAGIILMRSVDSWEVLSLLTLRQNIYTDPQKPLQIEPKLYSIGQVNEKSPVLVTTNFSLTYYTVLGEVEASKIPSYIVSIDTEGMSVLTAWAAEKFTPDRIASFLSKISLDNSVAHKRLIIPGYVAVMSGDLQDKSGWEVLVGPKEAAGLPSFLKKL